MHQVLEFSFGCKESLPPLVQRKIYALHLLNKKVIALSLIVFFIDNLNFSKTNRKMPSTYDVKVSPPIWSDMDVSTVRATISSKMFQKPAGVLATIQEIG